MNLHLENERGQRAKDLLESEMFREAIDSIRAGIVEKWRSCPVRDIDGQHELKLMDKVLDEVEKYLQVTIETGKMAQIQLSNENKIAELKRHGVR